MSQDTLLLLWEIPLDCTEYNKEVFIRACISLTPKTRVFLYLFPQNPTYLDYFMLSHFDY